MRSSNTQYDGSAGLAAGVLTKIGDLLGLAAQRRQRLAVGASPRIGLEQRPSRRSGAVVISILVLLVVITGILGTWAKAIVRRNRQLREGHHAIQVRWLAESGLRRAVARLAADREYEGETWAIPADAWGQSKGGVVVISVAPSTDSAETVRVTARADFPADRVESVRHTETIDLHQIKKPDGDG